MVTAALPYANGPVHIGHLAGCYLPSDIYVRYLRMRGRDRFDLTSQVVAFICFSFIGVYYEFRHKHPYKKRLLVSFLHL